MDLQLEGKKVLITGASRGIGAAIAEQFLAEGADVMLISRGSPQLLITKKTLQSKFGEQRVTSANCDCTDVDDMAKLKANAESHFGVVDIVVANIGDGRSVPDPLPEIEQWQKTWNNNFESALLTARTFMPMLTESKGNLLFISSIVAKEAFGAPVDYSTAKTAVAALAKNLARKVAMDVRVNVIAPGNVYFEGGSWDEKIKADPDRIKNIIDSTVPMKRFGEPQEIADAAVFLCSPRASFITGHLMVVDGGQTVGIF